MSEAVYYYKGVKVELKTEEKRNGNWGGRYQLTWPDKSIDDFLTEHECFTDQLAEDSARDEAHDYIDQRKLAQSQ
jgi:hypothetical protein